MMEEFCISTNTPAFWVWVMSMLASGGVVYVIMRGWVNTAHADAEEMNVKYFSLLSDERLLQRKYEAVTDLCRSYLVAAANSKPAYPAPLAERHADIIAHSLIWEQDWISYGKRAVVAVHLKTYLSRYFAAATKEAQTKKRPTKKK